MATTDTTENEQAPIEAELRLLKKRPAASDKPARLERIRTELNIEKWPAIWNPTHSKIHARRTAVSRTMEREITNEDGTTSVSKVTINPIAQLGDLTTEDQRTLYALIHHWEDRGKAATETPFSVRQLARLLHKKGWGTNVIDAVTGSLERLRGTMLVWTRSYRTKDRRTEDQETVYINILSKLKIVRRKVDGHVTTEAGYFQFDDQILKNLLSNYTKPFLFEVFIDIKGEIALKLYSYLDLIMADKKHFERRTAELFQDLGLTGASYRNPSKRKQNLQNALAELEGILLTTGVLKSATIEKTKDGKDYKVVFTKSARSAFPDEAAVPEAAFASAAPVVINDYSKRKDSAALQAEDLVQYFYKVFHGIDRHSPQSKETSQALSLISQHGMDKAKMVVDFARTEAAKTNFNIQHFGAVLTYASRALAAVSRSKPSAAGPQPPVTAAKLPPSKQQCTKGEARLNALTPEQRQSRFDVAKAELLRNIPFLAERSRSGSKLEESMVRSYVIRQLDQEVMDLLPLEALKLPEALAQIWPLTAIENPETIV